MSLEGATTVPRLQRVRQLAPADQAPPRDRAVHDLSSLVDAIVSTLRERTGRDFSGYRVGTVERRIHNRMISAGFGSMPAYFDYLRSSLDEPWRLLERVTIKVSRFYRNRATFDLLRRQELPRLGRERREGVLRVWCAGCGHGEEAYTLAMLLDEAGIPASVIATDIDPAALATARRAEYPAWACDELPADLAAGYLEPVSRCRARPSVRVSEPLRGRIEFLQHDVMSPVLPAAAPFDLIACRNVLIYLLPPYQASAVTSLCAALRPDGVLVLGEAEWPPSPMAQRLSAVDHKARVFRASEAVRAGVARWMG
jgi:chemotaxis methyl-accepting protein methylase